MRTVNSGNLNDGFGTPAFPPPPSSPVVAVLSASTLSGYYPLTVDFTDASINSMPTYNVTDADDVDYAWSIGNYLEINGTIVSNHGYPQVIQYTFNSPGSYIVRLYAANLSGYDDALITVNVSAAPVPVVTMTAALTNVTQSSATATFSINSTGGEITSARLFYGDGGSDLVPSLVGASPRSTTVVKTYVSPGIYQARLEVVGLSTAATASVTAGVNYPGAPVANFIPTLQTNYAQGHRISITDASAGSVTSVRIVYGNEPPVITTPNNIPDKILPPTQTGTLDISYTAIGPYGLQDTKIQSVTIPAYPQPTAELEITPVAGTNLSAIWQTGVTLNVTTKLTGYITAASVRLGTNGTPISVTTPSDPFSPTQTVSTIQIQLPANLTATPVSHTIYLDGAQLLGSPVSRSGVFQVPGVPNPTASFNVSVGSTQPNGVTPVLFTNFSVYNTTVNPPAILTTSTPRSRLQYESTPGGSLVTINDPPANYSAGFTTLGTYNATYRVFGLANYREVSQSFSVTAGAPLAAFDIVGSSSVLPDNPTDIVTVEIFNRSGLRGAVSPSFTINWGDGETETITGNWTNKFHDYPAVPSGTYTITLNLTTEFGTAPASVRQFVISPLAPDVSVLPATILTRGPSGTPISLQVNNNGYELTSQTILWGDEAPGAAATNILNATQPLTHTYAAGVYGQKTITVTSINGSLPADIDTQTVDLGQPPVQVSSTIFRAYNGAETALVNEPIKVTLPIAREDAITSTDGMNICDAADAPKPCQFKVLSRWDATRETTTAPIRAVQAIFLGDLPAAVAGSAGTAQFKFIKSGAVGVDRGSLYAEQNTDKVVVRPMGLAGSAPLFEISKLKINLVDGAQWGAVGLIDAANTAADGLTANTRSGAFSSSGFVAITPPTGGFIETVIEEGIVPTTTNANFATNNTPCLRVVIRQTVRLSSGLKVTLRRTFISGKPDMDLEIYVKNPNRLQSSNPSDTTDATSPGAQKLNPTQTFTIHDKGDRWTPASRSYSAYIEFVKYLTLGLKLGSAFRTTSIYDKVNVGRFANSTGSWLGRTFSTTPLGSGQRYRINQLFRNQKWTSNSDYLATASRNGGSSSTRLRDVANTGTPDETTRNLLYYQETLPTTSTGTSHTRTTYNYPAVNESDFGTEFGGSYPGGWTVQTPSGTGIMVLADYFSERAPRGFSVDNDTGLVHFHVLPDKLPDEAINNGNNIPVGGNEHLRGVFRTQNYSTSTPEEFLAFTAGSSASPNQNVPSGALPPGVNPYTGTNWRNGDFITPGYPDRGPLVPTEARPTTAGSTVGQLSAGGAWVWSDGPFTDPNYGFNLRSWQLRKGTDSTSAISIRSVSGYPDADTAYPLYGGMWTMQRLKIRLFTTATEGNSAAVKSALDKVRRPAIGLAPTDSIRNTGAFGYMLLPPVSPAGVSWDADRAEKFMRCILDDGSVEGPTPSVNFGVVPGSTSTISTGYGVAQRSGRSWVNCMGWGARNLGDVGDLQSSSTSKRAFGWDRFGNTSAGNFESMSNQSYDFMRWQLIQFVRSGDYRFYEFIRPFMEYMSTMGIVHSENLRYKEAGYNFYETGYNGIRQTPAGSHSWLTGQTFAYLITGDEIYRENLKFGLKGLSYQDNIGTKTSTARNPALFAFNDGASRYLPLAMHDLIAIYHVMGPVNNRLNAQEVCGAGSSPADVALLDTYVDQYENPNDPTDNRKTVLGLIRGGFDNYFNIQSGHVSTHQPRSAGFGVLPYSSTGTVGSISGAGPWTATITGMSSTANFAVNDELIAVAGTGSIGAGSVKVASIVSSSSITISAAINTTTNPGAPLAGTVTNITLKSGPKSLSTPVSCPQSFMPNAYFQRVDGTTYTEDPVFTYVNATYGGIAGRDYSNNGIIFYMNAAGRDALTEKGFMGMFFVEMLAMLNELWKSSIDSGDVTRLGRVRTLARKLGDIYAQRFIMQAGTNSLYKIAYKVGPLPRIKNDVDYPNWSHNRLVTAESDVGYFPLGAGNQANVSYVYTNDLFVSVTALASAMRATYGTAQYNSTWLDLFMRVFRSSIRYSNTTTGQGLSYALYSAAAVPDRPLGPSKSTDNSSPATATAYTSTGVPLAYSTATRTLANDMTPVSFSGHTNSNPSKIWGQGTYRGILNGLDLLDMLNNLSNL